MKKLIATIILCGSIWGFLECSLGDRLHDYNLSALMASMAIFLMAATRIYYEGPGMQVGMALVAALLRHFNPVGTCLICSSIAILIEGVAFEIVWSLPWRKSVTTPMHTGMGIISFYSIYALSYLATQILTPALTATFFIEDLLGVIPIIFFSSSLAGLIGAIALPMAYTIKTFHVSLKDYFYYPAATLLIAGCWIAVIMGI